MGEWHPGSRDREWGRENTAVPPSPFLCQVICNRPCFFLEGSLNSKWVTNLHLNSTSGETGPIFRGSFELHSSTHFGGRQEWNPASPPLHPCLPSALLLAVLAQLMLIQAAAGCDGGLLFSPSKLVVSCFLWYYSQMIMDSPWGSSVDSVDPRQLPSLQGVVLPLTAQPIIMMHRIPIPNFIEVCW